MSIPQANDVHKILTAAEYCPTDAENLAVILGVVERQGAYYAQAVASLELPTGGSDDPMPVRVADICERIAAHPDMQAFVVDLSGDTVRALHPELAEGTVVRCLGCLASWRQFLSLRLDERCELADAEKVAAAGRLTVCPFCRRRINGDCDCPNAAYNREFRAAMAVA